MAAPMRCRDTARKKTFGRVADSYIKGALLDVLKNKQTTEKGRNKQTNNRERKKETNNRERKKERKKERTEKERKK